MNIENPQFFKKGQTRVQLEIETYNTANHGQNIRKFVDFLIDEAPEHERDIITVSNFYKNSAKWLFSELLERWVDKDLRGEDVSNIKAWTNALLEYERKNCITVLLDPEFSKNLAEKGGLNTQIKQLLGPLWMPAFYQNRDNLFLEGDVLGLILSAKLMNYEIPLTHDDIKTLDEFFNNFGIFIVKVKDQHDLDIFNAWVLRLKLDLEIHHPEGEGTDSRKVLIKASKM